MDKPSAQSPPPIPPEVAYRVVYAASRDQRIRAGIIDHTIDSTIWLWLMAMALWSVFHLETASDARSIIASLASQFSFSISFIVALSSFDLFLCVRRGQSIGQLFNRIYKKPFQSSPNNLISVIKVWGHGLVSRCLGLPLLHVFLVFIIFFNPTIQPMSLSDFSLIEPEGSLTLLIFLFKIVLASCVLFGVFLPFGLGFLRQPLPTWYDRVLGVDVLQCKDFL
ncbi:RDD family protein [Aquirhabdus parva]|uniref:Uncharacterized protein n=1 Tax=Aquirhabdus parva TaxID=2283318 RepID=A0A345P600_9GAMM|nr:RDD family protein [Aquirhabdus parva]AXI02709.1 hypothetical protein HYN46_07605 [Aquirhabdus parva]